MAVEEHLVGRAEELGTFDDLLTGLDGGRGSAVVLLGEPGIGKTRLLTELADCAASRGLLVLTGSAAELEQDLPFWVFVDALDEYVESLGTHRLTALENDLRRELAAVLPSLSSFVPGAAVTVNTSGTASTVRCGSCSSAWR